MWTTNPKSIKNEVFNFFKNKFKENLLCRPTFISSKFRILTELDRNYLESIFTIDEIKDTLWNCGNDNCPGPDGFNFKFIKNYWDIIGGDVVEAVKHFKLHKVLNPGRNASFISLVPKQMTLSTL